LETKGPTSTLDSYEELVPLYNSEAFVRLAGKPYAKLSYKQRFNIGKLVSKCSRNSFLRSMATYPLFERDGSEGHREMIALLASGPSGNEGMAAFQRAEVERKRQLEEARARIEAERLRKSQPLRPIPHHKGDLILDGSLARLYYDRASNHEPPARCDSLTKFSLVIKAEVGDQVILSEEGLGEYIREEIEPAARKACPESNQVLQINVFFEGVHFARKGRGKELGEEITAEEIVNRQATESVFAILRQPPPDSITGKFYGLQSTSTFNPGGGPNYVRKEELLSLPGLRSARARGFLTQEKYAEKQGLAAEQVELLGHTVAEAKVWSVLKGGDYSFGTGSLKLPEMRDWVHVIAQAYGQSVIERCGNRAPGGVFVKEFKLQDPKTGRITDRFEVSLLNDLGKAGHGIRGGKESVSPLAFLFGGQPWFDGYVREGPIRAALDDLVKRHDCQSDILVRLHKNVVELVKHHGLD